MNSQLISFTQTTYYPLHLFSNLMRGASLSVHVTSPNPLTVYSGPTVPSFIKDLTVHTPDFSKLTKFVDVSAVLADGGQGLQEIRVAIVNRSDVESYEVPILFGPNVKGLGEKITIHEVWSENLSDGNNFEVENVKTLTRVETLSGTYQLKKHSFQGEPHPTYLFWLR